MSDEPSIWGSELTDFEDVEEDDRSNGGNIESKLGHKDLIRKISSLLEGEGSLKNGIRRYQKHKGRMDFIRKLSAVTDFRKRNNLDHKDNSRFDPLVSLPRWIGRKTKLSRGSNSGFVNNKISDFLASQQQQQQESKVFAKNSRRIDNNPMRKPRPFSFSINNAYGHKEISDGTTRYKHDIVEDLLTNKRIMNFLRNDLSRSQQQTKKKLGLRDNIGQSNFKFTSDMGNTEQSDVDLLVQLLENKNNLPQIMMDKKSKHLADSKNLLQTFDKIQKETKTEDLTQQLMDKVRDLEIWKTDKYEFKKRDNQSPFKNLRKMSNDNDIGSVYGEIIQMLNNPIFYPNGDNNDKETRLNLIYAIMKIIKTAEREERQDKLEFEKTLIGKSF